MSVSRGDAPDQRSARVGVHEDQTILVAAQRLQGFRSGWYISEPGTLKKHESLSARAWSVRDVDNGNGGSERAGPPSGGPVRSIRKNIVLPGSGPTDLHYGKNGYVLSGVERTGPPGGGPARVTGRRAPGERGAYRSTGHRSTETGNRRP